MPNQSNALGIQLSPTRKKTKKKVGSKPAGSDQRIRAAHNKKAAKKKAAAVRTETKRRKKIAQAKKSGRVMK